jgi:hypothetical protein
MSDLQTLLSRAVDQRVDVDVVADVRRGRTALRRRRVTVAAGVAATLLVVGGATTALVRPSALPLRPAHTVTATVHAGAFEVPPPPDGWSVWHTSPSIVVIAPDGTPPPDPKVGVQVMGNLAIYLRDGSDSPKWGPTIEYDGRSFFDNEHPGADVQVGFQEPSGDWLVLQEAPTLHWTVQHMIEYLDAVVVSPDAVPMSCRGSGPRRLGSRGVAL